MNFFFTNNGVEIATLCTELYLTRMYSDDGFFKKLYFMPDKISNMTHCRIDDRIVGVALCFQHRWYTPNGENYISCYVSPAERKKRIGYTLVQTLVENSSASNLIADYRTDSSDYVSDFWKKLNIHKDRYC